MKSSSSLNRMQRLVTCSALSFLFSVGSFVSMVSAEDAAEIIDSVKDSKAIDCAITIPSMVDDAGDSIQPTLEDVRSDTSSADALDVNSDIQTFSTEQLVSQTIASTLVTKALPAENQPSSNFTVAPITSLLPAPELRRPAPLGALFGFSQTLLGDIDDSLDTTSTVAVGVPNADNGLGAITLQFYRADGTLVRERSILASTIGLPALEAPILNFGINVTAVPLFGGVTGARALLLVGSLLGGTTAINSGTVTFLWLTEDGTVLQHRTYTPAELGCTTRNFDFFGSSATFTLGTDAVPTLLIGGTSSDGVDGTVENVGALWRVRFDAAANPLLCEQVGLPLEVSSALQTNSNFGQALNSLGRIDRNGVTMEVVAVGSATQEPSSETELLYHGSTLWLLGFSDIGDPVLLDTIDFQPAAPIRLIGRTQDKNLGNIAIGVPDSGVLGHSKLATGFVVTARGEADFGPVAEVVTLRSDGKIGNRDRLVSPLPVGLENPKFVRISSVVIPSAQSESLEGSFVTALASPAEGLDGQGVIRIFKNERAPTSGKLATFLLTMSNPGISKELATTLIRNAVTYASRYSVPRVLVVRDDNNQGEFAEDPIYISNILRDLGFETTFIEEPSIGISYADVENYDLVIFSNPGFPIDDGRSVRTLERALLSKKGVLLFGDDMAYGVASRLVRLFYRDNGTTACGVVTDNNAGSSYKVQFNSASHPLIRGVEGQTFLYGDDIDTTDYRPEAGQVVAWATVAGRASCKRRVPVIIAGRTHALSALF